MFRKLLPLAYALMLFCSTAYAASTYNSSESDQKVYLASDQLICSDSGIFVFLEDANGLLSKILVPQISWDENGLFVLAESIPLPQATWCRRGHHACSKCFRCDVSDCPAYGCKCRRH